ncbi:hypothetical protein YB2330_006425 [Saitoella coloradoensis]
MAHYQSPTLTRPERFNFATDVVDYWAAQTPVPRALFWTSRDGNQQRDLSYKHFSTQSHRIATLLDSLGVRKGDRLVIILPRIPEWWEIVTGCLRAGIVVCPSTTLLVAHDIKYRVNASQATVFVGDDVSCQKFAAVRDKCPQVKVVLKVNGSNGATQPGVVNLFSALSKVPSDATFVAGSIRVEDPAIIYFTSGTTGLAKMVLHNQISYPLAHTITGKHWLRLKPGDLYWNLSEQGWAKAAWSFFGTWNCGASLFIQDDRSAFDPFHLIDTLNKFPITTMCAPPTAYRQLVLEKCRVYFAANPPKALKHVTGAGEPLNAEVIKIFKDMSGGLQICDGYGQTETIMVCGNFAGNPIKPGSMGKPSPGVPLAVVTEEGIEAPHHTEGDMAIRVSKESATDGPNEFFGIFDGYILNGKAERRTRTSKDGKTVWYLTGDRATRDKDGYFWFVGRADDVINSAGYRIGPFEVESVLKQHPGIVESAVVASPDPERVEVVKAFIVLTDTYAEKNEEELKQEIQEFCKTNAAPYKYPRKIQFVSASFLPKTISGKIQRNQLRKMEKEAYEARNDAPKGVAGVSAKL